MAPRRSRLAATVGAALAVVLCATGCSGHHEALDGTSAAHSGTASGSSADDGVATRSGTAGPSRAVSSTRQPPDSAVPTGSHRTDMTSSLETTTAPTPTHSLPGGMMGIAVLRSQGWINDDGQLMLPTVTGTDTPTDARPGHVTASLCGFLFGTPRQVGDLAELAGEVRLNAMSTRHAEGDATVIGCVYGVGSSPKLALQVTDGPPTDPNLPGSPVIVSADGVQAILSYAPDYEGPEMAPTVARTWLGQAANRATVAEPSS